MGGRVANSGNGSIVEFVKLIPQGRDPKRADRSGAGSIPGRAMRFCDALTTATGYGYWLFPPIDMQLLWDGEQILWTFDGASSWMPLTGSDSGAAQFPGYADVFNNSAPNELEGFAPPFLTALPELGGVQIWTGLLARTKPGWSLNVRMPVNLPGIPGLTAWEGIVETDHWFGPLFTNFRLTRTDFPVRLRAQVPFMQIQPIPQIAYREDVLNGLVLRQAGEMTPQDWEDFGQVVLPDERKEAHQGSYAVRIRKRRNCPHHAAMLQATVSEVSEDD